MELLAHPLSSTIVAAFALGCFLFSAGVFSTLSFVEKPVWGLLRSVTSPSASDSDSRLIHAQLRRVIDLLPPTMMIAQASAFVLIVAHAWLRDLDVFSLVIVAVYFAMQGWLVWRLRPVITAAKAVDSDSGEIGAVRETLRDLLVIHHGGLAMSIVMAAMLVAALLGAGEVGAIDRNVPR